MAKIGWLILGLGIAAVWGAVVDTSLTCELAAVLSGKPGNCRYAKDGTAPAPVAGPAAPPPPRLPNAPAPAPPGSITAIGGSGFGAGVFG